MGNKTMEKLLFLVVVLDFFFYLSTCAYTERTYIHTQIHTSRKVFFSHCNETKDHRISRNKSFFFFLDNVSSVISVYSRNLVLTEYYCFLYIFIFEFREQKCINTYGLCTCMYIHILVYVIWFTKIPKPFTCKCKCVCMDKYVNNYN